MPVGAALPLASILPPDPLAGNIFARRLRYIHENTNGIFPACSEVAQNSQITPSGQPRCFNSSYEAEFNSRFWDKKEFRQPPPEPALPTKGRPRTQTKPMLDLRAFMQWKLPRAVTGVGEEPEKEVQSARQYASPPPPSPKKSATPRLPSLNGCGSRKGSSRPPASAEVRRLGSPRRSGSSQMKASPPPAAFHAGVAPRAAELLRDANPTERRVIEKALLLAEHSAINDSLRRSLQPEAELQVRKWLETASPEEREVALRFFHNLSGNKVMTAGNQEKKDRLVKVLKALESGDSAFISQSHPHFTVGDGSSHLHHIRLLTPNTRRNRWMHTTWHHLPPYRDSDPVDNRSSHYALPHRPIPRHFTIHPDWGN